MTSPMHIRLAATLGLSGLIALACGGAALEATSPAAPGSSATSTAPATAPVASPAATLAPTSSAGAASGRSPTNRELPFASANSSLA